MWSIILPDIVVKGRTVLNIFHLTVQLSIKYNKIYNETEIEWQQINFFYLECFK